MIKECNLGFVDSKMKECSICGKLGNWNNYVEYNPIIVKHSIRLYLCQSCSEHYALQIRDLHEAIINYMPQREKGSLIDVMA